MAIIGEVEARVHEFGTVPEVPSLVVASEPVKPVAKQANAVPAIPVV